MKAVNYFKDGAIKLKDYITKGKEVVPLIQINGNINAEYFSKALAKVPKKNVKFVGVVINSSGGAPAQCHIIKKKIEVWSEEKGIPIYTFAEDAAISGGYYVLTSGAKVFADGSSLLGGVGSIYYHTMVGKFLKDNDIYFDKYQTNKESLQARVSQTEKLTKDTQKVLNRLLSDTQQQFVNHVKESRGEKLDKMSTEEKDKQFLQGEVYVGREAVTKGVVDELNQFRSYVALNHPDAKIVDLSRIPLRERVMLSLSKYVSASTSVETLRLYWATLINQNK